MVIVPRYELLTARLGVDDQVIVVGVHPHQLRLRLAVGHQRGEGREVLCLSHGLEVCVDGHRSKVPTLSAP
jgi:hypothetical protein